MIEFKNVHFAYNEKPILRDVSFSIPDGEPRIIMGHSGSGKSTILRLILGLEKPISGEIIIDGKNLCRVKEKELNEIRKQIGMVFQDGALFDSLSVGENVGYYLLEYSKMKLDEIDQKVREMLGFVGLSDEIIDHLPDELSGGMQRRVAIGRALLSTNPKIMLYDEPTTGLDPKMTKNVINLINLLVNKRKVTSVVVTHQISDALEMANKFIIIDHGQVAFDGGMGELKSSTDPRVVRFLQPFRESVANVKDIDFV
ncbi:MAG: ATP-binding cassette domain-containing protein [Candidatus Zixiibacteriota bacterium]